MSDCVVCGCLRHAQAHAAAAAVARDDIDAALDLGLVDVVPCSGCSDACTALLAAARDERRAALAARERFRARARRLERRAAARRAPVSIQPQQQAPALPPGAAAVLARALSRARRDGP